MHCLHHKHIVNILEILVLEQIKIIPIINIKGCGGCRLQGFLWRWYCFALMRQARAWELDNPVPSFLTCMEANFSLPLPFFTLTVGPLLVYFTMTVLGTERRPTLTSFLGVSLACYLFANGVVALIAYLSSAVLHTAASLQSCYKSRCVLCQRT